MIVLLTRVPPSGRMRAYFVFPMNAIEMPLTYRFIPTSSTNLRSWCPQIAATPTQKLPGFSRSAQHTTRDFKIHYGGLLLRLLRPWGTRLTAPFPLQTSNRLRFRCTATGCSASTRLYKNGYVRLYSTFIRQRFDHWQWFPSLVSILHLPKLRFAPQLLLKPL